MNISLRKGWCPGALRPMAAKDGLLVRLRLTGGILPAAMARALADLAARHGNGLFDLSARGNLQMRGVSDASLHALQDGLDALGLLDEDAAAESVRNVIASPLAGLHGGLDVRPLVVALERRLTQDTALHALPGKFGFLIDDGSSPSLAAIEADIRFDWIAERGHFAIGAGGSRTDAVWIGVCDEDDLVERAASRARQALAHLAEYPEGRRMRHLLRAGLHAESLRDGEIPHPSSADAETAFSRKRETDVTARDVVGRQTFLLAESCLGLAAPFGRLDATMLRGGAALAGATPYAELRLTPWRTLLIPGASENLVTPAGFITDSADPRLAVAACVGRDGCARGTTATHADATALATLAAVRASPALVLHVSGCEKGCAKPSPSAITLVARDGRYDLVREGRAGDEPSHRGLDPVAARALLELA